MVKDVNTLLKALQHSPKTASKLTLNQLQAICIHVGLRKLGSKEEVMYRVIRYTTRKSTISDFLREKVYERIASHYLIPLEEVQTMDLNEIRNRFYAYRDKKPYANKDRCKEHLTTLQ